MVLSDRNPPEPPLYFERNSSTLFIHFDVPQHYLRLSTFIDTARRAEKVIEALDQEFFFGGLQYDLIVLPHEDGGFLTKLALWVSGGVGALFAFLNTDIGAAYVKGLTKHEPAFWAEQVGESNRRSLIDAAEWIEEVAESVEEQDDDEVCEFSSRVLVELTRGVLESSNEELDQVGMSHGHLPEAVEARNEFYETCLTDPDIKGVGFDRDHEFPVPRNNFAERAAKPIRRDDEPKEPPWRLSIENIIVTSPNWDKDDQSNRHWKGKDAVRRDCYFIIDDEGFWLHVRERDLNVEVLDRLKVQWAFQMVGGRPRNRRVIRVLEINDEKLADPLDDEAIEAILGEFSETPEQSDQGSLFGE